MVVKLNTARFDRLRRDRPGMVKDLAAALGCSVQCVKNLRWREGYGARSDGQKRLVRVNKWLEKEAKRCAK